MGLRAGQITVLIHSGSRGLGYQVCEDNLKAFAGAPKRRTDSTCRISSSRAPRCEAQRVKRIWGRCVRRRIMRGATASCCRTRRVRSSVTCSVARRKPLRDGAGLRRGAQHRQVRGPRRGRGMLQERLPSTARAASRFPAGASRDPSRLSGHGPASHHSREHGNRELGAGGFAGKHDRVVRDHLPRCGTHDEPHGRRLDSPAAAGSTRNSTRSASSSAPGVTRGWPKSNRQPTRTWTRGRRGRGQGGHLPRKSPACDRLESSGDDDRDADGGEEF